MNDELQATPAAAGVLTFDVLARDEGGEQVGTAIKQGFSWPALMFTFFWAFTKHLWVVVVALMVGITAINIGVVSFADEMPAVAFIFGIMNLGVAVFVGLKGNAWRLSERTRGGFKLLATVQGSTPSQVLSDHSIAPAPSLAYSLGAVVTATVFTAIGLFSIAVSVAAFIYGDGAFALQAVGTAFLGGLTGLLLWVRAFRPPVGFLRVVGVTVGGIMLGTPVVGMTAGSGATALGFSLGIGLLFVYLGFRPKAEREPEGGRA